MKETNLTIERLFHMPSGKRACDDALYLFYEKYGKNAVSLAQAWQEWDGEHADLDRIWFTLNYLPKEKRDVLLLKFLPLALQSFDTEELFRAVAKAVWCDIERLLSPSPVTPEEARKIANRLREIHGDKYYYAMTAFYNTACSFAEQDECKSAHYAYRAAVGVANTPYQLCEDTLKKQVRLCELALQ